MIAQSFTNYKHPSPYLPYPWCELPEHGKPFSDHDFTACLATALASPTGIARALLVAMPVRHDCGPGYEVQLAEVLAALGTVVE